MLRTWDVEQVVAWKFMDVARRSFPALSWPLPCVMDSIFIKNWNFKCIMKFENYKNMMHLIVIDWRDLDIAKEAGQQINLCTEDKSNFMTPRHSWPPTHVHDSINHGNFKNHMKFEDDNCWVDNLVYGIRHSFQIPGHIAQRSYPIHKSDLYPICQIICSIINNKNIKKYLLASTTKKKKNINNRWNIKMIKTWSTVNS